MRDPPHRHTLRADPRDRGRSLPLVAYGVWSLVTLQRGTRDSIVTGNLNVATRAAEEIRRYVVGNAEILKALAADLQNTGLAAVAAGSHPQELRPAVPRIPRADALRRIGQRRRHEPRRRRRASSDPATLPPTVDGVAMSPIRVDDDLLPTTTFAIHLTRLNQPSGWLVGEFSLEEMWRMVDQIRIGEHGFALVVAPDGALIAHGDPDKKALVAQSRNMNTHPLVAAATAGSPWQEYHDEDGRRAARRGGAASIRSNWTVIVEQPTDEAYASATRLQRQLAGRRGGRAARDDRRRPRLRPPVHRADLRAAARDAGPFGGQARNARRRSTRRTNSASSAPRSTRWPTGSSSYRRT